MGQARVQGYLGKPNSVRCELPLSLGIAEHRAGLLENPQRLQPGGAGRQVQPAQLRRIGNTPGEQLQYQWRKVGAENLRRGVGNQPLVLLL